MGVRDVGEAWGVYADDRKKVADLFAGRDTALPHIRKLPGHGPDTETAYREGAYFLPVVARTVEAFGGLVFAKTPQRTMPEALEPFLGDVTGSGQDIDRFAEQGFDGILLSGAVAVLVDYPTAPEGATKAEAEKQGIRPHLKLYTAGAVLEPRFKTFGTVRKLGQVRLVETVDVEDANDEFKTTSIEQVRVVELDDAGLYQQRVFRQTDGQWRLHETIMPMKGGKRLDSIPIYFSNTRDGEPAPAKPPVTDLAEISIAHLNNSAALEWGLIWTANPTPIFIGLAADQGEVKLGSSEGVALPLQGDAKFLEFTGAGLSELRQALDAKRKDAAMMGARMLLETPRQAIAAETARIERAGEMSVVGGIANALSDCLSKALTFLAEWAGIGGEVEYWLNSDLLPKGMTPQELEALLKAWQGGALSKRELFARLQEGDVVDPAKTFEEHEDEIAEEGPALGEIEEAPEPPPADA